MWTTEALGSKVTTQHLAKWAYVYVRQSSLRQVIHNQESTDLQYRLVERAVEMGWPRERVKVIDDDLGKSGSSATERHGFQHLLAELSLGEVGLVLSFDASRLARNNRDWYGVWGATERNLPVPSSNREPNVQVFLRNGKSLTEFEDLFVNTYRIFRASIVSI